MILIHTIIVFGITMILLESSIFSYMRTLCSNINLLQTLLSCFLCSGFWIGLCYSYFIYNAINNVVLSAIYYCTMGWLLHLIETKLGT